jgi:hypothetical protein
MVTSHGEHEVVVASHPRVTFLVELPVVVRSGLEAASTLEPFSSPALLPPRPWSCCTGSIEVVIASRQCVTFSAELPVVVAFHVELPVAIHVSRHPPRPYPPPGFPRRASFLWRASPPGLDSSIVDAVGDEA